jgi:hypothetical protein
MSYFLWIEDFEYSEYSAKTTASSLFAGLMEEKFFSDNARELKKKLIEQGVFIELSFQDGLDFIRNKLNDIDYIILDIDLPAYSRGDSISDDVLQLLKNFYGYEKSDDESEDERLLGDKCESLKTLAGYHLYAELVIELGFPKQHILFCSNHGENLKSIQDAFNTAKITLPSIFKKADEEVHQWTEKNYENAYSRLRRGIIEGCRHIKKVLESPSFNENHLKFNDFIKVSEKRVNNAEMHDYLDVLENFFPLREPNDADKAVLYKLFIRTLSHEWESTEAEKLRGLPWILKNTRNWIVHNSSLFKKMDEKQVAYLFFINMRVMFEFDSAVQSYEKILLNLFGKPVSDNLFNDKVKNDLINLDKAYLGIKNIIRENNKNNKEARIRDGFYFNELANNIQQSNSPLKNDVQLFSNLLYQMFWLTTSSPYVDTGPKRNELRIKFREFEDLKKPCIKELARHIYNVSYLEG